MGEPGGAGVARRQFLKQAGTVAWATPLILTLASSRANAQSCAPAGTGNCGIYSFDALSGEPRCTQVNGVTNNCCGTCLPVPEDLACVCQ